MSRRIRLATLLIGISVATNLALIVVGPVTARPFLAHEDPSLRHLVETEQVSLADGHLFYLDLREVAAGLTLVTDVAEVDVLYVDGLSDMTLEVATLDHPVDVAGLLELPGIDGTVVPATGAEPIDYLIVEPDESESRLWLVSGPGTWVVIGEHALERSRP